MVSGVPQGTVLGSLLFLDYINHMPETTTLSETKLFADDSLIYHTINNQADSDSLQKDLRRVSRCQRDNQKRTDNTMAKRKSTKGQTTINKTKDRVTRTTLKTGSELRCSGRVSSSFSTSDTHRVNLVTNPVISNERGKDTRKMGK